MSGAPLYDAIGASYTVTRHTEPRIASRVWAALGDARTVLNVGAGPGSYEPADRDVTAVEPSAVIRAHRPAGAARCVAAAAERLPFEDQTFDAAMAFSTVHHWQDPIAGLREMRRVARRGVVFTHDSSDTGWRRRFWLTRDYLPEVADLVAGRPSLNQQACAIGARIEPVLVPRDCADGFFEASGAAPRHTWTSISLRRIGVGQGRAACRAAGSQQPPRRPRLRPVGRTQSRTRRSR
jgi:SAM-dependent methyltransferase